MDAHAPPKPASCSAPTCRHFILGTAGHIDHGKTTLIRALTGIDTDRLPEEKRRGMTIELGFADLTIGEVRFGIVDVPGHERFIRTMVAGATGIDLALLIVAADDSVMPQTVEHVEILQLLGVRHGVVAITKIDMVDASMVELVTADVGELLARTSLSNAAICPVSSVTGAGIAALKQSIAKSVENVTRETPDSPFRMAVDRVFTVAGRGTVVTGSVLTGAVKEGDSLEVFPGGLPCRVRGLQSHGAAQDVLIYGQRAAINISGIDRAEIGRGTELATPGYLQPARLMDARLRCVPSFGRPLKSTNTVRLEMGTTEVRARVVLLEQSSIQPGEEGYAQLRLSRPITAVYGQRFILRDAAAVRTIGGGVVLRPVARRNRPNEHDIASLGPLESVDRADRMEEVLRQAAFLAMSELQLCARSGVELNNVRVILEQLKSQGRWRSIGATGVCAVPSAVRALTARLTAWLQRFHKAYPEMPGATTDAVVGWLERVTGHRSVTRPLLDELLAAGALRKTGAFICAPAFAPRLSPADEKLLSAMIDAVRAGAFQPPAPHEIAAASGVDRKRLERLLKLGVARGSLISIDGVIYVHADLEMKMREVVAELIAAQGAVTVSQVREALNSSRKFVVPFLEYLDRIGFTHRQGDRRVLRPGKDLVSDR